MGLALGLAASLLLATALAFGCAPLPDGDPPRAEPATQEPAAPAAPAEDGTTAGDPAAIPLPYAEGKWVEYRWLKGGTKVAEHSFRWATDPKDKSRIRVSGRLHFDEPGREFWQNGESTLARSLEPIAYEHTLEVRASAMLVSGSRVEVSIEKRTAEVVVHSHPDKEPQELLVELPEPVYLYENQAFEHWAVLAPVLKAKGDGTYHLLFPSGGRVFHIAFTKARTEKVEGKELERWDFRHVEFSGSIWLRADGSLEKYQQGEFEAVRTE